LPPPDPDKENFMDDLITVTPAALAQLRVVIAASDEPDVALRAAARRTDTGEIEFGMGLDEPREQDTQIAVDDVVTVLVSAASRELIAGTWIDYVEVGPGDKRFVFFKPQAPGQDAGEEPARAGGACRCGKGGCGQPAD
jgi:Fe-S cluster assembly iron-binding protein IscA